MLNFIIGMTEKGFVPDPLLRFGIRRLCRHRLGSLRTTDDQARKNLELYVENLRGSPVAIATDSANVQHYEVPAEFFLKVLGPHRKYSCAYWDSNCQTLAQAEEDALMITMERAELTDGMKILELGCGWGSLSIAMAQKFPNSKITAISNSNSQRIFIENLAGELNLNNIEILTKDVGLLEDLGSDRRNYDRVVSVEMFEHIKNYEILLSRISNWLAPNGKLFVHIFTHREFAYPFEVEGDDNWMGKYFFTGGQMPSQNLLTFFQRDLRLVNEWSWNGVHYQQTSEAWLKNLDSHRPEIMGILEKVYGKSNAVEWFNRWRIFFLAVAELFGYKNGTEWAVTHYLFAKK